MKTSADRADDTWAITKAPHVAEAFARNLARLRIEDACTAWLEAPSGTAVIVAPGHNLPDVIPGGVRFVVNSGVRVALNRGCVPDYVVCRESIDMSSCFEHLAELARDAPPGLAGVLVPHRMPTALLDVQVSPLTWATCERLGIPVRWFVPASMQTFHAADTLGVRPVYAGQTSVTAAIALAVHMGFTEVVLAGCARANAREGHGCVKDAGWGTIIENVETVTENGETYHVATMGGRKRQAELHAAAGQRPPLKRERVIPLTRLDGSTAWTTEGLADGVKWIEQFARRHPHVRWVQVGAENDIPLRGFEGGKPDDVPATDDDVTVAMRAREVTAAAMTSGVAAAILGGSRVVDVPGLIDGAGITSTHYAGQRSQIRRVLGKDPRVSIPPMAQAMEYSAGVIGGLVRTE